jgi:DNA-binding transcriptional MerR regulator
VGATFIILLNMFKIGEFARLTQVSAKALRLYDELGLLKPLRTDQFTDYRYYSADQLPRLHRILVLKELGFTLEQIKPLVEASVSAEQIKGMLMLKRAETEQSMCIEKERLMRIEAQIQLIEQEGQMSNYEVILKKVTEERVAGLKGHLASFDPSETPVIGASFEKVASYVGRHGAKLGLATAVYHGNETMTNIPFETTYGIGSAKLGASDGVGGVEVYTLPGGDMACTVHKGAFVTISQAYEAIMKWAEANGYRPNGPSREISHIYDPVDASKSVTEVQLPVAKA